MPDSNHNTYLSNKYSFLSGGGKMGRLVYEKDWSNSVIGEPGKWPQSLRTTAGIVLNSRFPMFLFWGPQLISFYNDAFRTGLGENGKHPSILGMPGELAWSESWYLIKPFIDRVLINGETVSNEDQLTPIFRNKKNEEVYWTFTFSAVKDESEKPGGVLVLCSETIQKVKSLKETAHNNTSTIKVNDVTEKVEARQSVEIEEARLRLATEGTRLATWDLDLQTSNIIHSARLAEIFGHDGSLIITHQALRRQIHPDDLHTVVEKAFEEAIKTSIYYYEARIIWPDNSVHWIRTQGKIIYNENNVAIRMIGTLLDITEGKINEQEVARLAAIVQSSSDAIISIKLNGTITSWNSAAEKMFGYNANEIIDKPIATIIPPNQMCEEIEILSQIGKGLSVYSFETRRLRKDHTEIDISLTISPIKDSTGLIIGASKIARDITRQKQIEKQMLESEEKFRLLASSMAQLIWTGDADGNLNYFNQAVYKFSGFNLEKLRNGGWLEIVHPDDREENLNKWMHSITTGEDFIFEHRFRRHDGEYRWQLSRALAQKDSNGKIQMWVGTSTDIHEIKENEEQKDFFISMASHELKTPITTTKGYIQILMSKYQNNGDAFLNNSLETVNKQIITLTTLITELLDLSKIKAGSLQLMKEQFYITGLINEIVKDLQHTSPDCVIDFTEREDASVFADKGRIGQVIINFLTNAIKYSPSCKEIAISSKVANNMVSVAVKDGGIGINKSDQQKIFERFYRVAGKDEKTFPGFGIGLFIAAEIIQRHEGKIGVASEPGNGSVFYFSLPLTTFKK